MFSTLDSSSESRSRRGIGFMCGLLIQSLMIGTALLVGVLFPKQLQMVERHYALTWLQAMPPEKPYVPPRRATPRVSVAKVIPPKSVARLAPTLAYVEPHKIHPTVTTAAVHAPEPPLPLPPVAAPSPAPKVQIAVRTGLFGGAPEPVTTKRPLQQVQTGGFGSPEGLPGRTQGGNSGNLAKLGSFGLPDGPGNGNGTGGTHGIQGVVASAGFGSGIAGKGTGRVTETASVAMGSFGAGMGNGRGGNGNGGSTVAMGSFEKVSLVAQSPAKNMPAPPPVNFQPIEILSKPSPIYTEEARRLGIQGDVALSVVFQANGAIKVIGVVKFLGHGLDQAAQQAATQIRFKPAQRDGKPTDFPATLHIQFRLADQST